MSRLVVRIGALAAFAIVALEWLVVAGCVAQSFAWWVKASDPVITRGVPMASVWLLATSAAVAYSVWAYDRLWREATTFKYVALVSSLAGFAGLLVFGGMVLSGVLELVHR